MSWRVILCSGSAVAVAAIVGCVAVATIVGYVAAALPWSKVFTKRSLLTRCESRRVSEMPRQVQLVPVLAPIMTECIPRRFGRGKRRHMVNTAPPTWVAPSLTPMLYHSRYFRSLPLRNNRTGWLLRRLAGANLLPAPRPPVRLQHLFTQPDGLRRNLHKFIVGDEFDGLLQAEFAMRDQPDG